MFNSEFFRDFSVELLSIFDYILAVRTFHRFWSVFRLQQVSLLSLRVRRKDGSREHERMPNIRQNIPHVPPDQGLHFFSAYSTGSCVLFVTTNKKRLTYTKDRSVLFPFFPIVFSSRPLWYIKIETKS